MHAILEALRPHLAIDGALRDILVTGVDRATWDRLLGALPGSPYPVTFTVDGVPQATLPSHLAAVEAVADTHHWLLRIQATKGVHLHAVAVCDTEIELDADPRELTCDADLVALLDALRWLSRTTGHPVQMTHEGMPETVFLRIDGNDARVV